MAAPPSLLPRSTRVFGSTAQEEGRAPRKPVHSALCQLSRTREKPAANKTRTFCPTAQKRATGSKTIPARLRSLLPLSHPRSPQRPQAAPRSLLRRTGRRTAHGDIATMPAALPSLTLRSPSSGFHRTLESRGPFRLRVQGWRHPPGCPTSGGPTGFAWRTKRALSPPPEEPG